MAENSSNNGQSFYTPPNAQTSDVEAFAFNFSRLLNSNFFIELVKITAVKGTAPNLTVDVLPLVTQIDPTGAMIENSVIYGCPVFRLQRGASAIIMDPVVGDIGMIAICDQDITTARTSRAPSVPGSKRRHSKADALYLGGFLNSQPTEYVQFTGSGININSSGPVNINGMKVLADGRLQLVGGAIVDEHDHGGVQSGGSRTNPLGS